MPNGPGEWSKGLTLQRRNCQGLYEEMLDLTGEQAQNTVRSDSREAEKTSGLLRRQRIKIVVAYTENLAEPIQ